MLHVDKHVSVHCNLVNNNVIEGSVCKTQETENLKLENTIKDALNIG